MHSKDLSDVIFVPLGVEDTRKKNKVYMRDKGKRSCEEKKWLCGWVGSGGGGDKDAQKNKKKKTKKKNSAYKYWPLMHDIPATSGRSTSISIHLFSFLFSATELMSSIHLS